MADPPAKIQYLTGSQARIAIIEALERSTKTQGELARECSIARSTVHNNIRTLKQWGWIRETGEGEYTLSSVGQGVYSVYCDFSSEVEHLCDYTPVINELDDIGHSVPLDALTDATLTKSTKRNPHAVTLECARLMRESASETFRVIAAGVSPYINDVLKTLLAEGRRFEIVTDSETMTLAHEEYFDMYERSLASDAIDLHVHPESIDLGLVLTAETAALKVGPLDDESGISALVQGSNDRFFDWAVDTFERYRSDADPLDVKYPHPESAGQR